MKFIRKLLFPIVPIYHGISWLRNLGYDKGVLSSKSYEFPVICVGNLSVGGTGKSPMIEYLIRLLKVDYKVATLSRGYKRSTKDFQIANKSSSVETIGDEPFQFYQKFEDIIVSVDNDRQNGISKLEKQNNSPDIILLDDAFQHRKVKAGLNILLTKYDDLYIDDYSLPTGNLREPSSGANRADIIIVTKCPYNLSPSEQNTIIAKLNLNDNQEVYFSAIKYSDVVLSNESEIHLKEFISKPFTLVTGIADASQLVNYLKYKGQEFEHLNFKDHHEFTETEIELLNSKFRILTTEKDYMRLKERLPANKLFYFPIEATVFQSNKFDETIMRFVKNDLV